MTFTGRYLLASSYSGHTTSGTALLNFDAGGPLHIDFDYPVRAFGADYGSDTAALFPTSTATLTLYSGQTFSFQSSTNPDSTFLASSWTNQSEA